MASEVQIVNMALGRIGVSDVIASLTEQSQAALSASVIFNVDRDQVLRDAPWPFATKYATAALVTGSSATPANRDWVFAYRYPADCHYMRRIVPASVGRRETRPVPFRVGRDDQGRLIYTNEQDAELEYTLAVTDAAEFDPLFVSALADLLGWHLAPALSRMKGAADDAARRYVRSIEQARVAAFNEGREEYPEEAEWIRARSGDPMPSPGEDWTPYPGNYEVT